MSDLNQCTPSMSSLVAQHITTSPSVLQADDFTGPADFNDYEDPVEDDDDHDDDDDDDDGGQQVEGIFEDDDGSEDEEVIEEEYVEDGDDESYDVDDDGDDYASSVSDAEVRTVEIDEACDVFVDKEICESVNVEETDDVLSSEHSRCSNKSRNTLKSLSTGMYILLYESHRCVLSFFLFNWLMFLNLFHFRLVHKGLCFGSDVADFILGLNFPSVSQPTASGTGLGTRLLAVPLVKLTTVTTFSVVGPWTWNDLLDDVTFAESLSTLR